MSITFKDYLFDDSIYNMVNHVVERQGALQDNQELTGIKTTVARVRDRRLTMREWVVDFFVHIKNLFTHGTQYLFHNAEFKRNVSTAISAINAKIAEQVRAVAQPVIAKEELTALERGRQVLFADLRTKEGFKDCKTLEEALSRSDKIKTIEELSLNNPDFKPMELPAEIGLFTGLIRLDLNRCRLSVLPEEIGRLTNLVELDVSHNDIKNLPDEIGQLTRLKFLRAEFSNLESLPESIGNLDKLEELTLIQCSITQLPSRIGQLKRLKYLDLEGNFEFQLLPSTIRGLQSLETLVITGGKLKWLPDEITQLSNLKVLDLQGNKLGALPENMGNLTVLERLDISCNKLHTLPASIGSLVDLQELEVDNNKLSALPDSLETLRNLQYLNISANRFKSLPVCLLKLGNLRRLNLDYSALASVPEGKAELSKPCSISCRNAESQPNAIAQLHKVFSPEAVISFY